MIGKRPKPKSGKVKGRIKKMFDTAASKGEASYQRDLQTAKKVVNLREADKQRSLTQKDQRTRTLEERVSDDRRSRASAAKSVSPVAEVNTKKASGMYQGSVPVAGTDSKKLMRKRNPIKGIRRSDASASVKKSMIRKMR